MGVVHSRSFTKLRGNAEIGLKGRLGLESADINGRVEK